MFVHNGSRLRFAMADGVDRQDIYRIRHEVYAAELGQHAENSDGTLTDALDAHNVYVIARMGEEVAGFVSVTPPEAPSYSLDKYVARDELPFVCDENTYEVRLLTVCEAFRGLPLAFLLLYAAYRWIEDRGGDRIFGIGRHEIKQIYAKLGAEPSGIEMQSGAVNYELMSATAAEYRQRLGRRARLLERLADRVDWQLDVPFWRDEPCFHGGAFFDAVGERFDELGRRHDIVNADVLDAWFPPSPHVTDAIHDDLEWLARTSPPTHCQGLIDTLSSVRGVDGRHLLPGAGSSALIYLAFGAWLTENARVLITDPMYGEYEHVLKHVVGCHVERVGLRQPGGETDVARMASLASIDGEFDMIVIVNPNSPVGTHVPRSEMEVWLDRVAAGTRVWIDETYVEYAGTGASLETYAARSRNVTVCKSMSKTYALSGMRVAYLCGPTGSIAGLRRFSPPWAVSLPGQLAAVRALEDPDYYEERYRQTHAHRADLAARLCELPGVGVFPSTTNFLLLRLPETGPTAREVVATCREHGVFLRDAGTLGPSLGSHAIRTAVKSPPDNERIVAALRDALAAPDHESADRAAAP